MQRGRKCCQTQVDVHSRCCWRPESLQLPNPLPYLLQLQKTMEGTASWLRGSFLQLELWAVLELQLLASVEKTRMALKPEATHCCQKQLESFFLNKNISILFIQLSNLLQVPLFRRTNLEIIWLKNLEI